MKLPFLHLQRTTLLLRTAFASLILLCINSTGLAQSLVQTPPPAKAPASIKITTKAGSYHLINSELTTITYHFTGLNSYPRPHKFELDQADMFYSHASVYRRNGINTYSLHYTFQTVKLGEHQIPAVEFLTQAGTVRSEAIKIDVYPVTELSQKTAEIDGKELPYFTFIKSAKSSLFPNETTHVEHKIYLPNQLNIALWGLPLGDKTNCTAWRFETPKSSSDIGQAKIQGMTLQSASFHTNLTSIKEGKASIGPLKSRAVFNVTMMTNRGLVSEPFEIKLLSDILSFDVKPLPANRPEHFRGDVGSYSISALIDAPSKISVNDSIHITAQLKGSGNLATVNPPLLLNMEGWKVISENRTDLGDNRKSAKGIAEFTYLIQPDKNAILPTKTPNILFVALDPESEKYDTLRIPSKPITVTPPTHHSDEQNSPIFDDIILNPTAPTLSPWYQKIPLWSIHILPLTFLITFFLRKLKIKLQARKLANSQRDSKKRDLAKLAKTDTLFLKSAGSYIERWINTDKHPEAKNILSLRDSLCYKPGSKVDLSKERRKKIIDILRASSLIILFCFSLQNTKAESDLQQALSSFQEENYEQAITKLSQLPEANSSPDIQYNIALSHQRNNNPGLAAYHYHHALRLDQNHASALKNLSLLEENYNVTHETFETDIERWISFLSPSTYLHLTLFLTGIIICLIITFTSIKPRGIRFKIAVLLTIFSPIFLTISLYSYLAHPTKSTHHLDSAIIIEPASLTTHPLKSSNTISQLPVTTSCQIFAERGAYTYIVLPNQVKGWIPTEKVKKF